MNSLRQPPSVQRHRTPRKLRPRGGFTLMELIVTVAIASILISIAAPSLSTMVANQRARGAAGDLYMSLNRARSEALKRNTSVTLQPATDGEWQSGWNIPDPSSTSRNIETHGALRSVSISGPANITYRSSGRVSGSTTPTPFDITASGSSMHWCVSLDLSGRPYQKSSSTSC